MQSVGQEIPKYAQSSQTRFSIAWLNLICARCQMLFIGAFHGHSHFKHNYLCTSVSIVTKMACKWSVSLKVEHACTNMTVLFSFFTFILRLEIMMDRIKSGNDVIYNSKALLPFCQQAYQFK